MSKITNKERLEIWEKWKEGKGSIELSKEYGINDSSIRYLVRLLEAHGPGVLNQGKCRKYSKELKEEAIKKVLEERESIESTSVQYGFPSRGQLKAWIKSYKENGYVILEKKKGRPPMKDKKPKEEKTYDEMTDAEKIEYLEKKALYLEAENEYLKKLHAVVQARKARQRKKK